jgi:hypothetical protein
MGPGSAAQHIMLRCARDTGAQWAMSAHSPRPTCAGLVGGSGVGFPGNNDQQRSRASDADLHVDPGKEPMAFKPNYRQQRAERDRQARAKQAEKLKKLQERSDQRKAEREATDPSAEQEQEENSGQ